MFSSKDLIFAKQSGNYQVKNSLRFRSSATAYLSRTPASAGNRQIYTISAWCKRGILTSGTFYAIYAAGAAGSNDGLFFDTTAGALYFTLTSGTDAVITSAIFRDPSAWYHICVSVDTTQATASNRIKIYVNGTQQTLVTNAGSGYPAQNTNSTYINTTNQQRIGAHTSSGFYLDGYLAEVNFIDGQALTPSSFGTNDPTTGVWVASKYTGTYGTNGFYLPFGANSSAETLAYDYSNSNPELISNGMFVSNITGWTAAGSGSPTVTWQSNHTMRIANSTNNGSWAYATISTEIGQTYYAQAFISAASIGGTSRTITLKKADNSSYSLNSVDLASTTQSAAPIGLQGSFTATATTTYIIIFIDIIGTGTTGADVSQVSVALGGYKKNWNPFNISTTAGTTYDAMIDAPNIYASSATQGVGNYCTLNPNGKLYTNAVSTVSNANLTATGAGTILQGTMATAPSGKFYYEMTATTVSGTDDWVGFILASATGSSGVSSNTLLYRSNGQKYFSSWAAYGNSWANGDVIGCAIDLDNGAVYFARNNTWQNSGDPTSGSSKTGAAFTNSTVQISGISWGIIQSLGGTAQQDFNFGQRPFSYTPPSGFKALNTSNLPTPTITNGAQYMAAVTYAGSNSSQTINPSSSGVSYGNNPLNTSFQPDFVWIKSRNSTDYHNLTDSVRGVSSNLFSNTTDAADTATRVTSFNSNGITLGGGFGYTNVAGQNYVAWEWKAGGTGVSNTSGSITSTVSANTSAGFSVVTYTGNGTTGATVGHGLGVIPSMVIVKERGNVNGWYVYHTSLGNTKCVYLDSTSAQATVSIWNNTTPTSSLITYNNGVEVNRSSGTYVAYCFAPVAGYSAFGSYTGNGSADGPFMFTGFRPRFILIKMYSGAVGQSWSLHDTSRSPYNVDTIRLQAESSNAESNSTSNSIDILSNGFKIRTTDNEYNNSSYSYIYAAFAENPFKYSNAR